MEAQSVRIAAVIPAKGQSQRVHCKNRQLILGVPLFLWAANNLSRVLPPQDIYVDSDSVEIRELAEHAGFRSLVRPQELADNKTCGNGLMVWGASQVEADIIVQHLPPMPFLRAEKLKLLIEKVRDGAESALGAVVEPLYLWNETGPTYDRRHVPNSVDLKPTIVEGMGIYVARREAVLRTSLRIPGEPQLVELDRFEAIDIDTPHDLEFARTVAAGLPVSSPYRAGIEHLAELVAQAA